MTARSELDSLLGAISFFTRLRVPGKNGHGEVALERAIRYFPAVGLLIGAIAALVFVAASLIWPKTLALIAAIAAAVVVTGAIHEDGWSDMVDGFGGGANPEKVLAIMRDSALGSYGALALAILIIARFFTLLEIDAALLPVVLIAGHAVSRLCATFVLGALDYARSEGKAKPFANRLGRGELVFATLCALAPLVFLPPWPALAGLLLALIATRWLARLYKRRIGGYTGDCLGATQQLAELAFYGGLLCRFS